MFKDNKGVWRTKTLFVEMLGVEDRKRFDPPFTLQECDIDKHGKTYKSLYRLFMTSVDEYDFATTHLGGLGHWEKLKGSKWFGGGHRCHKGAEQWLEDMRARDESNAKKVLMLAASEGDTSAAKKLLDYSKKPAETQRGRFIKAEARKEAVKKADDNDLLSDAALRLNVVPIRD